MINEAKPTTTLTNSSKVSFGELWSTILTTYASETRTWGATASLFTNSAKQSSSIINISKPA